MATPVRRAYLNSANLKADPATAAYDARLKGATPDDDLETDPEKRRAAYEARAAAANQPSLTGMRPAPPTGAAVGAGLAGAAPVGSTPPDITNMQDAGLQPNGSRDLLAYGAANAIPRPAQQPMTESANPLTGDTNGTPGGGTTQPVQPPGAAPFTNPGSESIYKSFAKRLSSRSGGSRLGSAPRTGMRRATR